MPETISLSTAMMIKLIATIGKYSLNIVFTPFAPFLMLLIITYILCRICVLEHPQIVFFDTLICVVNHSGVIPFIHNISWETHLMCFPCERYIEL